MPAYVIVNFSVDNPDQYKEYSSAAGPALKIGEACQLVAFDAATDRLEGDSVGHQTVILRFDSKEEAKRIWESGDYQALVRKRHAATSNHFAVLVNGIPE